MKAELVLLFQQMPLLSNNVFVSCRKVQDEKEEKEKLAKHKKTPNKVSQTCIQFF